MKRGLWTVGTALAGLLVASAGVARAEEPVAPTPAGRSSAAALILDNLLSQPIESREAAFQESLRRDAPRPAESAVGASSAAPDGSVRMGRTTLSVTVRNPCPDGDLFHDATPRPLPGRTRR